MLAGLTDRSWIWIAAGFYLTGFLLGTWSLLRAVPQSKLRLNLVIAGGYACQFAGLYLRGLQVGGCPLGNQFELFQFTAWSALTLYFAVGVSFRSSVLGYFTSTLACVLTVSSLALPAWDATRRPMIFGGHNPWIELHASLALFSYGVFALLALTSLLLLLRHHSLESKKLGGWFSFLPPIFDLDQICVRLLVTGVVLLMIALLGGSVFWLRVPGSVNVVKILVTVAVWLAYALTLGLRLRGTLLAKRFAWVCSALFIAALVSLWVVDANRHSAPRATPTVSPAPMNADAFFVLGATHHKAPISVRERLALRPEAAAALIAQLRQLSELREFTLLSTCNRLEFYGVATHPEIAARVQTVFCEIQHFDPAEFEHCRLALRGPAALHHLLEVAAGLDSQLLGENEIFGQVKDAYAAAQAAGHTGPVLNRVFQKAFQAAKHVRTNTAIAAGQVSIYSVAVELAQSVFGSLETRRVLLLGAGDIGEKTARAFQSRGATSLTVSSRSFERAMQLATALHASAMPFEQREARLAEFDLVVSATSAPGTVVSAPAVRLAMQKRPASPFLFLDLAMPRDIDAAAAELENVFLYNLDDLAIIAEENRVAREAELAKCQTLLAERTEALWQSIAPRLPALVAPSAAAPAPAPAAMIPQPER